MEKIKLHLGCGNDLLPGYINIDKKLREGVNYDFNSDILDLKFYNESVDEIRLHHVFEHFHRYQTVVLMFVWNNWLKKGGKLTIETPDFEWCCRKYLNLITLRGILWNTLVGLKYRKNYFKTNKWRVLRHVFGSKEADWANHLEGWDKDTLSYLFELFGFKIIEIKQYKYKGWTSPNVRVTGEKTKHITDFDNLAKDLLEKMVSNDCELPIWMNKARELKNKFENNKNVTSIVEGLYK